MIWSEFTFKNINKLNKNININNSFIDNLKKIRQNIYEIPDINYTIEDYIVPKTKLNELKSTNWVATNLTFDDLDYNIKISWNNNNIYLKTTNLKFNNFKNRLPIFLKVLTFIQNKSKKNINIYFVLSKLKKYIDNEIISPNNINSGYTNTITEEIFIWREEEFEKVCFHELIHLFNLDHRDEEIHINTNIKGEQSYYESITDFKAIIYNIIYISLCTKCKIMFLLNKELQFINNQAIYINNNLQITKRQNTPAYSYYIIKNNIFKYYLNNKLDIDNINFSDLIDKINNYKLNTDKYNNFKSARMTLLELV
jgi:hypothetical protein